ncbi:MAG: uroporphyrinogen-III C-methyltransferase, partial [Spirochaetes bacterium]|nr:uroporphyrinogen-III C-methyltransferase [Spirochaetota bacterium]
MKKGIVYLVGAGPGDPGLFTVKSIEVMKSADCIIYDYLANNALLSQIDCEKIYVGKKGSDHTLPQDEINRLIIKKAMEGKTVVRLKGGDPFIFGRGGEEAEELLEAGIPFSIIPGISSFYSSPAYAGIPLTHRDFANAFEVITGHRRDDASEGEDINFPEYDPHKSFIFLMGMKNLQYISEQLINAKKFPADTPVGIISWGTTPRQKVAIGNLTGIAEIAKKEGVGAPAIIVVGGVVGLREKLRWFDTLPLFGIKIVVTRTREQASALSKKLGELGAWVIEFPTIEIKVKSDMDELYNAIEEIANYDWIIFTSQNAVKIFFNSMKEKGMDARNLYYTRLACIGPATANELRSYFIEPDL